MGTDETAQEEAGEQETNDEEPTVEQMLENLDELKEKRSRSLRPYDVVDQLPTMAKYEDGELKVAVNRQWEKVISLTPLRRKILSCLEKGMEQQEIVNRDIASQGYVAKTKNDFGFLLDNPALYDAFVERALRTEDDYIIRGETGEDEIELSKKNKSKATKTAERLISNGWDNVVIEEPDGNVLSYSKNRLSSPQSPDSSDQVEQEEPEEQTRPLLEDEYTNIVAALHRDNQDELAKKVIKTVWGGQ